MMGGENTGVRRARAHPKFFFSSLCMREWLGNEGMRRCLLGGSKIKWTARRVAAAEEVETFFGVGFSGIRVSGGVIVVGVGDIGLWVGWFMVTRPPIITSSLSVSLSLCLFGIRCLSRRWGGFFSLLPPIRYPSFTAN